MDNEIKRIEKGAISSDCNGKKKRDTGRRKIEIKKIENNKARRIVTFSKRTDGLFRKSRRLCRAASDVNLLAFTVSPGRKKTFSFSKPDRETVLTRYFRERFNCAEPPPPPPLIEAAAVVEAEAEPAQTMETTERVEAQAPVGEGEKLWWDKDVEELDTEEETKQFLSDLKELKAELCRRIGESDHTNFKIFSI